MKHFFLLAWVIFYMPWALAQEEPKTGKLKNEEITKEYVQQQIKRIEAEKSLEEGLKKNLLKTYSEALEQIDAADRWEAQSRDFLNLIQNAPNIIQRFSTRVPKTESESKLNILMGDASLASLEQILAQAESELNSATKESSDLETEIKYQEERKGELPKLASGMIQKIKDLKLSFYSKQNAQEHPELAMAKEAMFSSSKKAMEKEMDSCEKEILSFELRYKLLTAQKESLLRQIEHATKNAAAWRQIVNKKRHIEADWAARQARSEKMAAAKSHPTIRSLTEENATLAELRAGLASKIDTISYEYEKLSEKQSRLSEDFKIVKKKVDAAGMSNSIALLLRKKRADIPDIFKNQANMEARQDEIPQIDLKRIELQEIRDSLQSIEMNVKRLIDEVDRATIQNSHDEFEALVREQLKLKREYLDALIKDYNTYFSKLVDFDTKESQFVHQAIEYKSYIEERIFWIRSAPALEWNDLKKAGSGLFLFLNAENFKNLFKIAEDHLFIHFLGLAGWILLISIKSSCRKRLQRIATLTSKVQTDNFLHTIEAFLLTMVLAFVWPSVFWFVSWRLSKSSHGLEFVTAISEGLYVTAWVCFTITIFRAICIPLGLGESHFRWNTETMHTIRRNLFWLLIFALPIVFVVAGIEYQSNEILKDSLGRITYVFGMFTLSVFLYKVLKPSEEAEETAENGCPDQRQEFLRYLWHPLALLAPIGLAVLASVGYYYTAFQLTHKLWTTLLLIILVLVVYHMLLRWLFFIRCKLAERKANKLKALKKQLMDAPKTSSTQKMKKESMAREEEADIPSIMAQSRRFLVSLSVLSVLIGLWVIWGEVLPALKILKRIELWYYTARVPVVGNPGVSEERIVAVNLSDILAGLLISIMTLVASKNLPALIEMWILNRLHTDRGIRFAIVTLTRYVILFVGFIVVSQILGISWVNIQWLVAAFTVGLGFGLQEIFANFISGLILLFERPIRVGDVVTSGDVTGTVSKIRIRATTILDWDRKELIVPNKEFITGRLVNWTLSDPVSRLIVPVGVAYGTDTELVHSVLLKVAQENPNVLKEPKPSVLFKGFGESSLDFELRAFIPHVDLFIKVKDELHSSIYKVFKESRIEIPFPQRDLHIRSTCPKMEQT